MNNEIMHDSGMCRKYMTKYRDWLVENIEIGSESSMKRHMRIQKLNTEKCDRGCIKI